MKNNKNVAIIGAGVGGLAIAIRLSALGFNVNVYEANSYPGGKLSDFQQDGFHFDAGPSLFTMPSFIEELFQISNENIKDYFEYQKMDISCQYFYEDGTRITAFSEVKKFSDEVSLKLNVSKYLVSKYMENSKKIYETTKKTFLEQSLHKIKNFFSFDILKTVLNIPHLHLFTTLNESNKTQLKHPKLVQLFNRFATYNGSNPYEAPGILQVIPHLEHNIGTFLPKGGMIAITNALYNLALKKGVNFHFNSKVEEILIEKSLCKAIKVNNEIIKNNLVVSNLDVYFTYTKLLKNSGIKFPNLNQERSSSALIFYWGINHNFKELDLHNIFFSENYEEEFKAIFKSKTLFNDPTIYINITSKYNPEDAPNGNENWFVMINVPSKTDLDWKSLILEAKKNILEKLSRILKIEIEPLILTEAVLDPQSIENKTGSYLGALYGTSSNNRNAAFFRHPNFSNSISNLFFCGGSVHPGGGIPLVLNSAKITAQLIQDQYVKNKS